MNRRTFIERTLRQIYNGQPSDDATITVGLVNTWLNDAIALASKANYKDNLALDGIGYVNNSFYSTFKGITVSSDEVFLYKITLPSIPIGIGYNEGISTLKFKSSKGEISNPVIWMSENQAGYYQTMRPIPNKILAYPQGEFVYVISDILLTQYTATVTMVSGGVSTDLDSTLNVPSEYFPIMSDYIKSQLMFERQVPVDVANDGLDTLGKTA